MKLYPAPISRRFWAWVLDCIFVIILYASITLGFYGFASLLPEWMQMTGLFVLLATFVFYQPICESLFHGQTLGKMALGICVVDPNGNPVSGVHCFQRFLFMPIDMYLTFGVGGLISMLITERRQRIGDLAADTVVVWKKPNEHMSNYFAPIDFYSLSTEQQQQYNDLPGYINTYGQPMEDAAAYRQMQCKIAQMRTQKQHPVFIEYMESALSTLHISIFKRQSYTFADMFRFVLQSVPRAVYEARKAILASLVIAVIATMIGVYSQHVDPDFFRDYMGDGYTDMTLENIQKGDPMGVYSNDKPIIMTLEIFWNNFMVTLRLYIMGIFTLIGPLYFLLINFVMVGTFDMFFAQQGYLGLVLVSIHQHGVLELASIIIAGGASIQLGTGWLFPGKLSRWKAFTRSARRSLLVLISTIPMLFVAAIIEGFITRHTEWPLSLRLSILIVSLVIIIGYYVVLPRISNRN